MLSNKYMILYILVIIIVLTTFIVDVTITTQVSGAFDSMITADTEPTLTNVISMLDTYFNLLTFGVDGLPAIFTLLFFYPINAVALYMIVNIITEAIPF